MLMEQGEKGERGPPGPKGEQAIGFEGIKGEPVNKCQHKCSFDF